MGAVQPFWPSVMVRSLDVCCSVLDPRDECLPPAAPPPTTAPTPEPAPSPTAAPDPEPKSSPARTLATPSPTRTSAAAPRSPTAPAAKATTPPGPAKAYSVQVRSYQEESAAQEFIASLAKRGFKARIIRFVGPDGATWFRVRIGLFKTLGAAQDFAHRFNQRQNEQAIVVEVK
jgi:cell division protein FtsN